MTEERWRNVAIGLGVVFVALVVIVVATSLPSGTSSPTARPSIGSPVAGASGTPSASQGGAAPSEGASAPAAASPSASPKPSASPTLQPTAALAAITFTDFKLDADASSSGKARTFTFKTDGPGNVKAKLSTKTRGTTTFCLKVGSGKPVCRNFATGTLTGTTTAKGQTTFVVTLIGVGVATPTVDLNLSFRAKDPSVALTHGRFDGTSAEGYDGMRFRVKVRSGGSIATRATWGGKPFDYSYGLVDPTDPAGAKNFTGNATGIDRTDPVTPSRTWGGTLLNSESGFGRTPLKMTVAWH